jgi:lipopolysaccharide transport system permease protein
MVTSATREYVVDGSARLGLVRSLAELWANRGTVLAFAARSTRLKYKQSVIGIGWAVLQPLGFMAIFAMTVGRIAQIPGTGTKYAAFALSTLVPWTFVNIGLQLGHQAIVNDAHLIRKVYFPREAPVIGTVLSAALDFGVGLLLFFVVGPLLGARVTWWWFLAPALAVPLFLLVSGVCLAAAALNAYYRDFRYAVPIGQQIWLFASPVAYPLALIAHRWRGLYLALNPVAGLLDSFAHALAIGIAPRGGPLLAGLVGSFSIALVGYWFFKRLEPSLAEVV